MAILAGTPESLSPVLNKVTDDQGREVSINMDIFGTVHRTTFNKAYDSYGSLVSYCDSITQLDNETTGETHRWLGETKTTRHWVNPSGYGWYSRVLNQNDYGYDLAGNRTSNTISIQPLNSDGSPQVDQNANPVLNSRTEQYGYDEINRLTSVDYGDGETQGYGFDPMGNRLQKTDTVNNVTTTEGYSYDNANMLLSRGSNSYTNDAAGNTLTGGGRTNTWDSQNRLTQCVYNGTTSNFVYGADGLRRQMSVTSGGATTTTNFAIEGDSVVREMRTINGALTPTTTYFNGVYRRDDLSGSLRWYVFDGLGSVIGEVDPAGNLTCNRGYDVYGATRNSTGTPTSKHGFGGQLGHPTDDETGLVYMRARYYDAVVGRFASEDQGKLGSNWYMYAGDSPLLLVDRSGKDPSIPGIQVWDIFNMLWGYYQVANNLLLLANFVQSVHHAQDPTDVEAAWSDFISGWGPSSGINSTAYAAFQMTLDAVRCETDLSAGAGLVTSAVQIATQLAVLCIAYDVRLQYYEDLE